AFDILKACSFRRVDAIEKWPVGEHEGDVGSQLVHGVPSSGLSVEDPERFGEKVLAAKVPGLQCERDRALPLAWERRYAGTDPRPDGNRIQVQASDHGARCLATSNDKPRNTGVDYLHCNIREQLLQSMRDLCLAVFVLKRANALWH